MALILGSPNGGTRRPSWAGTAYVRGVRREVKHLSTCRKGYSVSSGERKRIRPNRLRVIPVGGCVAGVVGSRVPVPTGRAGVIKRLASPVPGREPSSDRVVPSSAGLVESRVNQPRPLGKSKHTCLTDSVPVP